MTSKATTGPTDVSPEGFMGFCICCLSPSPSSASMALGDPGSGPKYPCPLPRAAPNSAAVCGHKASPGPQGQSQGHGQVCV